MPNMLTGALSVLTGEFKPQHVRLLVLVAAVLVTLGVSMLFDSGLRRFEESTAAVSWRLNPSMADEASVNIIAIDEASIAELGPYPWPRETMARLSQALTDAGVQLQMYDILFAEGKEGDAELVAALQNTKAVIAQTPTLLPDQTTRTGLLTHALSGVACNSSVSGTGFQAAAPAFAAIPKGGITAHVDSDGAVREIPAYICIDDQAYPALALSALLMLTNADPWSVNVQAGTSLLDPAQILRIDSYPGLDIPLDSNGDLRVSFRKHPLAYTWIPAIDVINGKVPAGLLDNSTVLVAVTTFGAGDIVPTPYSGGAPGAEVHARIIGSLLDDAVPYTPRGAALFRVLLGFVFALALLWVASARERASAYALVACALLFPGVSWMVHAVLLNSANLWLGWLSPALYGVCAATLLIMYEYARVRLERGRVLGNLSSYLPSEVAQEIAYTLPNSSISARRQDVTLLSADLRNFSAYGEARPPEEAAALLHYFFVRTTEIIEKHAGRVHEFKGDSLLAIWDGSDAKAAAHALAASLEMQQTIQEVLPQHPPAGLEPLALGIGFEQGPVLIGSIGPAHRRSHTLLGETVTIALRIQELTAELACPILIGECAARYLSDHKLQSQGSYLLNGLRIPHTLFAPSSLDMAPKVRSSNPGLKVLAGGRQ